MQQLVRDPESAGYSDIEGDLPKSPKTAPKSPPILCNRVFRLEPGGQAGQCPAQRFEPFPEPAPQRPGQFIATGILDPALTGAIDPDRVIVEIANDFRHFRGRRSNTVL